MRLLLLSIVLGSGFLCACSSSNQELSAIAAVELPEPGQDITSTSIEVPDSLAAAVRAYQFDYAMTGVTGAQTAARALLFEPGHAVKGEQLPLIVWAHGTTGIANACAPSLDIASLANTSAMNALLSAGYAVLAPDYEGFGTSLIHPYYVRSSHANSVLAAIQAVHKIHGINLSNEWAIIGHSQGGHVALATARAEPLVEFPLQAVIVLSPGTDLVPLSQYSFAAIDADLALGDIASARERMLFVNVYSAYVAHAFNLIRPQINPASFFADTMANLLDLASNESSCGEFVQAVSTALQQHLDFGSALTDFAGLKRNWHTAMDVADLLEQEALADEMQQSPLLVIQGDADRQIPIAATDSFVELQRSLGTNVSYEVVVGADHHDVVRREFHRSLDWLSTYFPAN